MQPKTGRVVIPAGQSESSPLELVTETIVGVYMSSSWDTADLGFSASQDGTNFSDIAEFGTPTTVPVAAGQYIPLDFTKFVGVAYLKFRSESGGSPVNQTAERVLSPAFRTLE